MILQGKKTTGQIYNTMKSFKEWVAEKHPESLQEGKLGRTLGAFALGAASLMPNTYAASPKPATAAQQQDDGVVVKEEDGKLIIRATVFAKDDKPESKLSAMRVAEVKITREAARYFHKKGGAPGFAPPFKIQGVSEFLRGETDYIWSSWDISRLK